MKAMLYADWMNFRQSIRSILFVMVVFAATALVWNKLMFFNFIVVTLSIMIPTTLFAADQAYGWNRLSLSLPILRRDVVGSKFLIGSLINLALLGIGSALASAYCVFYDSSTSLAEVLAGLLVCEAVSLFLMGVLMAVTFRFGIEKGRYIVMACVWVPVLGMFVLEKLPGFGEAFEAAARWLDTAEKARLGLLIAAAVAVSVAVYLICYLISLKIYQRTEL